MRNLIKVTNNYFVEMVNSPDDEGYYAEVINTKGKTVYTTAVWKKSEEAYIAAVGQIDELEGIE